MWQQQTCRTILCFPVYHSKCLFENMLIWRGCFVANIEGASLWLFLLVQYQVGCCCCCCSTLLVSSRRFKASQSVCSTGVCGVGISVSTRLCRRRAPSVSQSAALWALNLVSNYSYEYSMARWLFQFISAGCECSMLRNNWKAYNEIGNNSTSHYRITGCLERLYCCCGQDKTSLP